MKNLLRKWLWRTRRVLDAAWTYQDRHYFVVDGYLYEMRTHGSDKPYEWTWELVTRL
jgi:hypothetical protein